MTKYWPTIARYVLMIVAGLLLRGGYIDAEHAATFTDDAMLIEMIGAALAAGGAVVWYVYSEARKALKERLGK